MFLQFQFLTNALKIELRVMCRGGMANSTNISRVSAQTLCRRFFYTFTSEQLKTQNIFITPLVHQIPNSTAGVYLTWKICKSKFSTLCHSVDIIIYICVMLCVFALCALSLFRCLLDTIITWPDCHVTHAFCQPLLNMFNACKVLKQFCCTNIRKIHNSLWYALQMRACRCVLHACTST